MSRSSIFNLPRKKEQLRSTNKGMSNLYYDEISSLRTVIDSGDARNVFGNGLITFRWQPSAGTWWIPNRSYFRIDCSLTKPDGVAPIEIVDNIAINMGAASCLFQKQMFKINDKTVSQISEHVAQVDALKTRLKRTGAWLDSTGSSLNFWDDRFDLRQAKTSRDGHYESLNSYNYDVITDNHRYALAAAGNTIVFARQGGGILPSCAEVFKVGDKIRFPQADGTIEFQKIVEITDAVTIVVENVTANVAARAIENNLKLLKRGKVSDERRVKRFSLIYVPPLSVFDLDHAIPGSSKFEIDFTPFGNTIYQKNMIESLVEDKVHTTDGINGEFRFKVENMLFYAARCEGPLVQKDEFFLDLQETRLQISTITTNDRSQFSLNISPSTQAISVAFQDEAAETNTIYSQSRFKVRNDEELNLTNFYLRYGGVQKPSPDYRPVYSVLLQEDRLVEQYARTLLYNGSYHDSSAETIDQWRERGMYLSFAWPKDGTDRETRCYVSTQFSALTGTPRLLVFNHFSKVVILKYDNGSLVQTIINEA